jgi:uncharacterized phage-associated protein
MSREEFRNNAVEKNNSNGLLTIEEVLTTKGFEHFTTKEAEEYIQAMVQFCMMAYKMYSKIELSDLNFKKSAA